MATGSCRRNSQFRAAGEFAPESANEEKIMLAAVH